MKLIETPETSNIGSAMLLFLYTLWWGASHRGLSCWMAPALLPGCSSASPGTSQSSAPLLNIFLLPAQAAHIHPKCIWFLLVSDGTSGCVGCGAGPEQHSNDQVRAYFKSTVKPTIPLHSKRLPWRNPGPGCTNHTAPSMLPREPVFFQSRFFLLHKKVTWSDMKTFRYLLSSATVRARSPWALKMAIFLFRALELASSSSIIASSTSTASSHLVSIKQN